MKTIQKRALQKPSKSLVFAVFDTIEMASQKYKVKTLISVFREDYCVQKAERRKEEKIARGLLL